MTSLTRSGAVDGVRGGDDCDAVGVADDDVAGGDDDTADGDGVADDAGAVLERAGGGGAAGEDGQALPGEGFGVADDAVDDGAEDAFGDHDFADQVTDEGAAQVALAVDDQDVTGLGVVQGVVDGQVVPGPGQDRQGGADEPGLLVRQRMPLSRTRSRSKTSPTLAAGAVAY